MKHKEVTNVSKSAHRFIEQAKNVTTQNLASAVASGVVKVDRAELPRLVALIQASIDEGYHHVIKTFEKDVEESFSKVIADSKSESKSKK